jgi:hypothetical protein
MVVIVEGGKKMKIDNKGVEQDGNQDVIALTVSLNNEQVVRNLLQSPIVIPLYNNANSKRKVEKVKKKSLRKRVPPRNRSDPRPQMLINHKPTAWQKIQKNPNDALLYLNVLSKNFDPSLMQKLWNLMMLLLCESN